MKIEDKQIGDLTVSSTGEVGFDDLRFSNGYVMKAEGELSGSATTESKLHVQNPGWKIYNAELSEWKCFLFGGTDLIWQPRKGEEPNWFWRWMQYVCFGNKWVKDLQTKG